jgi:hypothetical protein
MTSKLYYKRPLKWNCSRRYLRQCCINMWPNSQQYATSTSLPKSELGIFMPKSKFQATTSTPLAGSRRWHNRVPHTVTRHWRSRHKQFEALAALLPVIVKPSSNAKSGISCQCKQCSAPMAKRGIFHLRLSHGTPAKLDQIKPGA